LLILIFARLYMAPWHLGVFTVAGLVGAWACWPEDDELRRFTTPARRLYRATAITLLVIVAWQVYPSFTAIRHDLRAAYSGSADAAQYLKAVSAERTTVYAFGYGATAILPYFSSNIYANQVRGDPSFWRWTHDGVLGDLRWESVDAGRPEYVVFAIKRAAYLPPLAPTMFMEAHGYTLVHSSPGILWSEFGPWETDDYLIYRRTRP
jgi:hypothetical protein